MQRTSHLPVVTNFFSGKYILKISKCNVDVKKMTLASNLTYGEIRLILLCEFLLRAKNLGSLTTMSIWGRIILIRHAIFAKENPIAKTIHCHSSCLKLIIFHLM